MQQIVDVVRELVRASGPSGMVSGQSLDLTELANPAISETKLREIHMLKTGQLMLTCINMVLAAGKATPAETQALRQFASHLGLFFQMQDDYLDQYGAIELLGKGRASDAANQKTTFATLFSQEELAALILEQVQQAHLSLTLFGARADHLHAFLQELHLRSSA
jgi:farnesyl diphosphate synthase